MLDEKGSVIGHHEGSFFFTIGERHGFTITTKTPEDAAYYVISKDIEQNTITVAHKNADGELPNARTRVSLKDVNWIQGHAPEKGTVLQARARYRQPLQSIRMIGLNVFEFEKPQFTLSAGQSLVIYRGEECLGGGVIE